MRYPEKCKKKNKFGKCIGGSFIFRIFSSEKVNQTIVLQCVNKFSCFIFLLHAIKVQLLD